MVVKKISEVAKPISKKVETKKNFQHTSLSKSLAKNPYLMGVEDTANQKVTLPLLSKLIIPKKVKHRSSSSPRPRNNPSGDHIEGYRPLKEFMSLKKPRNTSQPSQPRDKLIHTKLSMEIQQNPLELGAPEIHKYTLGYTEKSSKSRRYILDLRKAEKMHTPNIMSSAYKREPSTNQPIDSEIV